MTDKTKLPREPRKLKGLSHETNRHGKKVWYYLIPGRKGRIRIRGEYGTKSFLYQYDAAVQSALDRYNEALLSAKDETVALRRTQAESILQHKVKNARTRDKSKGRIADITPEWAIEKLRKQQYKCAVTGIEFLSQNVKTKNNPYAPSLDRIDNSKGYTRDNIRIVLFAVNAALLDWGVGVFNHINRNYSQRLESHSSFGETALSRKFFNSKDK